MTYIHIHLSDYHLKERLFQVEVERDEAERKVAEMEKQPQEGVPAANSVARPRTLNGFTVTKLRGLLELQGDEHKQEWNSIRVSTIYYLIHISFDIPV